MSFISSLPKAPTQEKQNKLVAREGSGITINPETNEIEASSIVKNFVTNKTDIEPYVIEFNDETDEAVRRIANISVSPTAINITKSLEPKNSTGAMKYSEIRIDEEIGLPPFHLGAHNRDSNGSEVSSSMYIDSNSIGIDITDDDTGNVTGLHIGDCNIHFQCDNGGSGCFADFNPQYFEFNFRKEDGTEPSSVLLSEEEINFSSNNVKIKTANNVEIANFLVDADSAVGEASQIKLNGYLFINSSDRNEVIVSSGFYRTYRTNHAEFLPDDLQYFDGVDSECLYIDHPVQVAGDLFFTADLNGVSHGHIRNVAMPEYDTDAAPAWYVHKVAEQYLPHIYSFIIATSFWTTPSDADKVKYPKVAAVKDLTINGISSDQTQQLITVIPVESCMADYFDCGIMLIAESENTVRIACSKIPSSDMDITICVQPARSEGGVN